MFKGACPENYTDVIPGSLYCYGFITHERMTFDAAWEYCREDNAHLILVRNEEQNALIANFTSNQSLGEDQEEVWLSYKYHKYSKSQVC